MKLSPILDPLFIDNLLLYKIETNVVPGYSFAWFFYKRHNVLKHYYPISETSYLTVLPILLVSGQDLNTKTTINMN